MSTTLTIPRYIRQTLQGRTPATVATTAMDAAVQQAYDAMQAAPWTRVAAKQATLPRHAWAQTGFLDTYDAATYCGDYAAGYQHAYACAVAYTYRMPATALDGTPAGIESIAIPALGDRWLASGCSIGVWISASATPPTWAAVLAGTGRSDLKTALMAVTPSNTGTDSSATITFDWSGAPKTTLAYVHIVVYMTSYLVHRGAWIEGGAMIDGANVAWQFTETGMTADTTEGFDDLLPIYVNHLPPSPTLRPPMFNYATAYPSPSAGAGLDEWRRVLNNSHVLMAASAAFDAVGHGAYAITADSLIQTVGAQSAFCFFSTGRTFDALIIEDSFSAAITAGVDIRVTAYGIASGAFGLTPAEWLSKVHADTASPGAFWRGASAAIKVLYDDATDATLACVRLASVVVPGGGYIGHGEAIPFESPWTPTGDAAIVVAFSVADLTALPASTPDTPYGWMSSGLEMAFLRQI